jgi:CyaY protein
MTESEFFVRTDELFTLIESEVEAAEIEVEPTFNEGVLEFEFADSSKIIVNRHAVNQEVWIAAKGGGFHYQFDGKAWHNTRSGALLLNELAEHISRQAGRLFSFCAPSS